MSQSTRVTRKNITIEAIINHINALPYLRNDLSSKYTLDLLSWMLGPEYILENYLQVTDNYLVEEVELDVGDVETETEDPTFEFDSPARVRRYRDSSDSEESSLTSLDSASESLASGSSEFWDSRSSDGEDYLMSAEDNGDDKRNLIHQSEDLGLVMFNNDVKKRMFESDHSETDNNKRQKMDLNGSPHDNDDDEISSSKDQGFESGQLMPVVTSNIVISYEDKFVAKVEDVDHSEGEIGDTTAAA